MSLAIIVAASENNVIGDNGRIPWKIGPDLRRFRALTFGHPVIMGRKTFDSLPKKPLEGRVNLVVSHQNLEIPGAIAFNSPDLALEYCKKHYPMNRPYAIGGFQIYSWALRHAEILELTRVHITSNGNVKLPEIDFNQWVSVYSNTRNDCSLSYTFNTYIRNKGFSN